MAMIASGVRQQGNLEKQPAVTQEAQANMDLKAYNEKNRIQ
jgi:hypothetical protein